MQRWFSLLLIGMLLIGCAASTTTPTAIPEGPVTPITAFNQLQRDIAATEDQARQQQLIDQFFKDYPQMPLVDGETVVFLVENDASQLYLTGDMTNWLEPIAMERLGQTNVWAITQTYPISARLDYKFAVGGGGSDGLFNDPRNPVVVRGGFMRSTQLSMPNYISPTEIISRPTVPQGTLEDLGFYKSAISNTTHELIVYLPPNYDPSIRYPTVYFQDGDDYRRYANTPTIFDNAIADGKLPPLIGVFVTPSREQGRQTDYNLNDAYSKFFATELVPMIDSRYSTLNDPRWRVVVGDSYGGLISLYIALLYPDTFGGVVNHSGFVSRYAGRLITFYTATPTLPLRIDTVVGTFETCVGGIVTEGDCNFLEGNRALRDILELKGYDFRYNEYPQGHSWGFWRDYIDENIAWVLDWPAQQPPLVEK